MEALQFHHHHHHHHKLQVSPISSCNFRPNTAPRYLRSIVSDRFSTSLPKLCTTKVKARSKDSDDEIKRKWLHSLTSPFSNPDNESNCASQCVIGIDPDVSGAIAVLKTDASGGSSAEVYDSPNVQEPVGSRIRNRLNPRATVELLQSLNIPIGTTAYIEQACPHPRDGKQGWSCCGSNDGLWKGVLLASGISVVLVPSMRWKREFKLCGNGSTKDNSRDLASELFPPLSSSLTRKKDHGRAEALLIAEYGKAVNERNELNC